MTLHVDTLSVFYKNWPKITNSSSKEPTEDFLRAQYTKNTNFRSTSMHLETSLNFSSFLVTWHKLTNTRPIIWRSRTFRNKSTKGIKLESWVNIKKLIRSDKDWRKGEYSWLMELEKITVILLLGRILMSEAFSVNMGHIFCEFSSDQFCWRSCWFF